jgi:sugar transferase (PEP-CTERM system associated)
MNKFNNVSHINDEEPTMVHSSRLLSHTTQFFQHHIPTGFVILGLLELVMFMLAFYGGVELRFLATGGKTYVGPLAPKAFLFSVVMLSSLIAMGAYRRGSNQSFVGMVVRVASALVLGMLPLAFLYYFAPMFFLGRGALALAVILSLVLIVATRFAFDRLADQERFKTRVLVLGTGSRANLVRKASEDGELNGLNIVGFVHLSTETGTPDKGDILPGERPLVDLISKADVDQIVLAVDDRRKALPVRDILDCKMSGISVVDLLTFFERETGKVRLDILQPSWLFLSDGFRLNALRKVSKRVFDMSVVLLMLPFALPLMLLAGLAVFLESGGRGPIFYRQTRVGENGNLFQIIKFRSMRVDAESDGPRWASANDTRITAVGSFLRRSRLDELPQLYNVLKGEMSFVGPRPERPEFTRELRNSIPYYSERHRVKPGLTGWAQIRYPYGASADDAVKKLQYDLYYVKNYSIFLDLLILFQTAEVVLLRKGAH